MAAVEEKRGPCEDAENEPEEDEEDDVKGRKKAETFVTPLGNETNASGNLQDAFLKYKRLRQKEIKQAKKVKRREVPNETRLRALADPDRMWALRMKFLEQAKNYFGTPYAKKYWKPEDPEYYSPRFLDCCGLVRRVMLDLRFDFGFKLGPWNQGYMYDMLPITLEEKDMKPGDLVFISAIYYSKTSKKQKHNLTHVEIWLGDGPKTIGSRWNKGKVQIFDSYRFKPQAYHSEEYHFKSIDTWLMGICRSHCREHQWKMRGERFKPCKKSVFSLSGGKKKKKAAPPVQQEEEEDEGESAGDDGIDEAQLQGEIVTDAKTESSTPGDVADGSSDSNLVQKQKTFEIEDSDENEEREEEEKERCGEDASRTQLPSDNEKANSVVDFIDAKSAECREALSESESESESESGSGTETDESVDSESKDVDVASPASTRPKTTPAGLWLGSRRSGDLNRDFEVRGERLILHSRSEDYFASLASSLPRPTKNKRKEKTFTCLTEEELDNLKIVRRPTSVPANVRLGLNSDDRVTLARTKETFHPEGKSEIIVEETFSDPHSEKDFESEAIDTLAGKAETVMSLNPRPSPPALDHIPKFVPEIVDPEAESRYSHCANVLDLEPDLDLDLDAGDLNK